MSCSVTKARITRSALRIRAHRALDDGVIKEDLDMWQDPYTIRTEILEMNETAVLSGSTEVDIEESTKSTEK